MARWALLSGSREHRKSVVTMEIVQRLRDAGVRVGGFVQGRRYEGEHKAYEILRLGRPGSVIVAVEGVAARGPTQEGFCTYAFRNEAFELARAWIEEDANDCDVLVLDDVSKLEVAGKGHAASVAYALGLDDSKLVLVAARASQLFYVIENFGLSEDPVAALELPGAEGERERFVTRLLDTCERIAAERDRRAG